VAQVIPLRRPIFVDEQPAKPSRAAKLAPIGALLFAPVAALMAVTIIVSLGTLLFWALMVVLLCAAILVTRRRRGPVWSWARRPATIDHRVIHPSSW
jgi:Flp pilus assembly protein TadB